ncbi:MAG: hydroxymethylbilane synthase [Neisseriaceae bacterium]|nr:MAG: hydroxymethylbilane synthase [Neisseriaceae bacterium]
MGTQIIRIGTRSSQLALWQANLVKQKLEKNNITCELVYIQSVGDLDLKKPIYKMSEIGVFTKALDQALLEDQIDLAVHSMKDVPTVLTSGLTQAAVLKRGEVLDILVFKGEIDFNQPMTVATGSLRRQAQWLAHYPEHTIVNLRGNLQKRLDSLYANDNVQGAIFAKVGLERLSCLPVHYLELDWMIPAPAQGAIVVLSRENDESILDLVQCLNDDQTIFCVSQERAFLRALEGGCAAPIGALMTIDKDLASFRGGLFSLDGRKKVVIDVTIPLVRAYSLGKNMAEEVLKTGGEEIMQEIRGYLR